MFGLGGWHMLVILGVLLVMAAVVVGVVLTIIALARRTAPVGSGGPVNAIPGAKPAAEPIEQIRQLAELRDQGLLTEEEFQAKRAELLGRI